MNFSEVRLHAALARNRRAFTRGVDGNVVLMPYVGQIAFNANRYSDGGEVCCPGPTAAWHTDDETVPAEEKTVASYLSIRGRMAYSTPSIVPLSHSPAHCHSRTAHSPQPSAVWVVRREVKEVRSRNHPDWPILKIIPRPSRDPSTGEIPALHHNPGAATLPIIRVQI